MHAHSHVFSTGEQVYARTFCLGARLYPQGQGPSFILGETQGWTSAHLDYIWKCPLDQAPESLTPTAQGMFTKEDIVMQAGPPEAVPTTVSVLASIGDLPSARAPVSSAPGPHVPQSSTSRYPSRTQASSKHISVERTLLTLFFVLF